MDKIVAVICVIAATTAAAEQPLKEGTFICEDSFYSPTKLIVKRHPTKPHKLVIRWENRDRILHQEPTETGALRYEGAVSRLVYIQTPTISVVLDDSKMDAILTDCKLKGTL